MNESGTVNLVNSMQAPLAAVLSPAQGDADLSDDQIVERVRSGDRLLYELLMRRYNQRLYRIIRSILGDDSEAEDALQETYFNAYAHLDKFRGEAKFATWLARIAVYEASRRRRRRRGARARERRAMIDDNALSSDDPAVHRPPRPEQALEAAELRQVLAGAIDRLPAKLRTVVTLREVEGLGTAETAECLGVSESNVRVRLHRARTLLQEEIDRRLGSEIRMLYQFGAERCDRVVLAVMQRINTM